MSELGDYDYTVKKKKRSINTLLESQYVDVVE